MRQVAAHTSDTRYIYSTHTSCDTTKYGWLIVLVRTCCSTPPQQPVPGSHHKAAQHASSAISAVVAAGGGLDQSDPLSTHTPGSASSLRWWGVRAGRVLVGPCILQPTRSATPPAPRDTATPAWAVPLPLGPYLEASLSQCVVSDMGPPACSSCGQAPSFHRASLTIPFEQPQTDYVNCCFSHSRM
jgi:hypothetical protein